MTVAVPGTKKVSVCSRRIGTRDRLNVIAMAISEQHAEKIVDALNALQGKLDTLDAPSRSELEATRQILVKERARSSEDSAKHRHERAELHDKVRKLETELMITKQQRDTMQLARDAAQKTARETA